MSANERLERLKSQILQTAPEDKNRNADLVTPANRGEALSAPAQGSTTAGVSSATFSPELRQQNEFLQDLGRGRIELG